MTSAARRARIGGALLFVLGIGLVAGPVWLAVRDGSFPTWSRNATVGIVLGPVVLAMGLWAIVTGHGKDPATNRMSLTRRQTAVLVSVLLVGLTCGAAAYAYFVWFWAPARS